jgi:uncharacterized iron-regulated membrane protein
MHRGQWYKWHSFAGVKLAILLCFILLTGTLAVLSHELDWLTNPAVRAAPHAPNQIAWTSIYEKALKASQGDIISIINAPVHSGFAAEVIAINSDNNRFRLYFDPQSGSFQGTGAWFNWQTVLRRLHRHLMMPLEIGLTIVAATSIFFTLSLVSGLTLHKKWIKGLIQKPRGNNRRVFWGDWHRLLGLWSSWLLLVMVITGLWYLAEHLELNGQYPKAIQAVSSQAQEVAYQPTTESFSNMLKQVQIQRPNMTIGRIRFPTKEKHAVYIEGQEDDLLVRDRANNLVFDPFDGQLLSQQFSEDLSLHIRISEAADPLHFGTWGGYPSKILYFLFGIALTSMSITGTYIYAMRVNTRLKSTSENSTTFWVNAWNQMSPLSWFTVFLLIISLALSVIQMAMFPLTVVECETACFH